MLYNYTAPSNSVLKVLSDVFSRFPDGWLRYQVRLENFSRRFAKATFPSEESAREAALAFFHHSQTVLAKFDGFKGKAHRHCKLFWLYVWQRSIMRAGIWSPHWHAHTNTRVWIYLYNVCITSKNWPIFNILTVHHVYSFLPGWI